ncbi:LysR family transcriptional regulator [Roseomonas haemaphysalidis]|uniref:LysR family transcriptional regulator n=1 Tax=Roseomonas haemaphysalidis TaxID=2768162 RepID=A0ABS3KR42_9PROT|nr:LysR family transcriptional regulator [Roseomonas haemaphysalidis]MBO1079909.1 LysR family transcriptional regulator [Roseomonas haemaphysalidis]
MKLAHLETFAAVIATGSLSAAARQIGRSQSAVTRVMQELEAQLGFPLLDRNGPRVTPTERALLFHDEVERSLAGMRRIAERAAAIAGQAQARIEIAAIPSLAAGLVPAALGRLAAAGQPQQAVLAAMPAGEVVRALLDRRADLGFASLPVEHRGLDLHWIGAAPCVAVLPAGHRLARHAVLPLAALHGEALVTLADPDRLRRRLDRALDRAGARPATLLATNTSLAAIMAARAGLGVALVDPVTASGVAVDGTVVRPLDAAVAFSWGVVTPVSRSPGAPVRAVMQAVAAEAARLPGFVLHPPEAMEALVAEE